MPVRSSFLRTAAGCALTPLALCLSHAVWAQAESGRALSTITINASADASAEGLKAPYAGGQVARGGRVGVLGNQDVMDTPFSQTSYTQELIQNLQATSIGDVLKQDPTVRVARGFGNYQQLYIVRGFPVYSDDMTYNGLYGLLPRQYLAAELVERVEVLRGANAFVNGAAPGNSGLGGSINVMPKRAPNEPVTQVTVGAESGLQGYLAADIARRFGPDQSTGLRLTAVHRDGDTAVDREERELSLVSLGADWRSRNVRVSADIGYQKHVLRHARPSVTPSATAIPRAPDSDSNYGQAWTNSTERDVFGSVRAEVDLSDQVTAWLAAGARQGKERNNLVGVTVGDAAGNATGSRFANKRQDDIATGEAGVRANLSTGSVRHELVASLALFNAKEHNNYAGSLASTSTNLYQPTQTAEPALDYSFGDLENPHVTGRTRTRSLALADTLSFVNDTVRLTLGARHQNIVSYGYDYSTGVQSGDAYDKGRWSPLAGLVFKASKQISLYANYAEGLVRGDTASGNDASGNPLENQGQVFAPAVTKQAEVGAKFDMGRVGATVAVFQARKPVGAVVGSVFVGSAYKQRNQGIETTFFGEPVRGLRLLGGLTYLDTDIRGQAAIGAPKWQGNAGAEWEVPGVKGLSLNGRLNYTGKQYADLANTLQVRSWTTLDVGARYTLPVGQNLMTLRGSVTNLADRNYWASVGGYPGANYLVQGNPRTFVVSATFDF
ncbi:TonB-dependent receptor [Pseudorhodoferax soli]|uniref:Iron complex outermembrane receptor protein n=1 Tax=Pseudorhodoferax soli TaxID=545864 RepID=A0A368XVS5_9BURK|nr:TonB-dependent receptor [Pseudorhodoferax soli]RCW71246.1 iron complex outermembrane receptor protein [Pseudorhodoferax soli]